MNTNRLLVHPVRARIVSALAERRLTRDQIGRLIPETPAPSLYRNLRILVEAGQVEIVERIPRRGVEEHVYALVEGGGQVGLEEAATWTPQEWQRGLDIFLQGLSMSYRNYLAEGGDQPAPAHATVLHLTSEERDRLGQEIGEVIGRYAGQSEAGRQRYLLSVVTQPDDRDGTTSSDE